MYIYIYIYIYIYNIYIYIYIYIFDFNDIHLKVSKKSLSPGAHIYLENLRKIKY